MQDDNNFLQRQTDDEILSDEQFDGNLPVYDDSQQESEGGRHLRLRVGPPAGGTRLDVYLQGRFSQFSRSIIQKLIKEKAVNISGRPAKPSTKIRGYDIIDIILPPPEIKEIIPQPIPLNIIYEDDDMIVLNKQADLIVHPARGYKHGTLVNGLVYYVRNLSEGSADFRPGIVHRLDRNTTGVLVVAKNDTAHWRLARQFELRQVRKYYCAIVHGIPDLQADCIDLPIGVHPRIREKAAVRSDTGREAITYYEVMETFRGYCFLKLDIRTGRTHQIRVHLEHIKHPIVGDDMYGGKTVYPWQLQDAEPLPQNPIIDRPALHAWQIEISHPQTRQRMKFEAPLPQDMQNLLDALRKFRSLQ